MILKKYMKIKLTFQISFSLLVFSIYCQDRSALVPSVMNETISRVFNATPTDAKNLISSTINIQNKINIIEPTQKASESILTSIKDFIPSTIGSKCSNINTKKVLLAGGTTGALALGYVFVGCGGDISQLITPELIAKASSTFLESIQAGALVTMSNDLISGKNSSASNLAIIALTVMDPKDLLANNLMNYINFDLGLKLLSGINSSQAVQTKLTSAQEEAKKLGEKIKQTIAPNPKVIVGSVIVAGAVMGTLYYLCPDINQAASHLTSFIPTLMNVAAQAYVSTLGNKIGKWAFGGN